jgi:hypothetical protein
LIAESACRREYAKTSIPRALLGGIIMSERVQGPYDCIARKWLALIERRQENFIDLCNTGRWRHYYTKAEFLEEMKKVLRLRDQWAALAGEPEQGEDPELLQNIQTPHRVLPDRLVTLGPAAFGGERDEPDMVPAKRRVNELLTARWPA